MFSVLSFQESFAGLNNGVVLRPPSSGASENLINFFVYLYLGDAGQNNAKLFQQVLVFLSIPHTFL